MELLVNMIRQIIGSIMGTVKIVESGHGGTYLKHSRIGENQSKTSLTSIMDFSASEVFQKCMVLVFTCEMDA